MQPAQFRNFTQHIQPPQRSPHRPPGPAMRRGIGPMPPGSDIPPQLAQAHAQAQAQQQAQQASQVAGMKRAKIRSKRPTDKNMPDGVEDIVIGDGVQRYRELREMERRLDAAMMRKKDDMRETVNRNVKRYRTLRVWISNTVEDQAWQADSLGEDAFDFGNMDASYRVKIEGRLLDEEEDNSDSDDSDGSEDEAAEGDDPMDTDLKKKSKAPSKNYRFSHFFKAMTVDFERGRGKDGTDQSVEWKKPQVPASTPNLPNAADFDRLEFKRGGDENVNITINLVRDENPEVFRLSPPLAELLDLKEATKSECLMGIWEYVRARELQEDDEKRFFDCDDALRNILRGDKGAIPQLPELLGHHLLSLEPIKLPYTIRCDRAFHSSPNPPPTIYDIRVSVEDPLRTALKANLINPSCATNLREIAELNNHTATLIQAIAHSKNRHAFFEALSKTPTEFLAKWLASQKRDLEVLGGETMRGGGEGADGDEWWRGGADGVWGSRKAKETVGVFVAGRLRS